jgi:hypothetical protein
VQLYSKKLMQEPETSICGLKIRQILESVLQFTRREGFGCPVSKQATGRKKDLAAIPALEEALAAMRAQSEPDV